MTKDVGVLSMAKERGACYLWQRNVGMARTLRLYSANVNDFFDQDFSGGGPVSEGAEIKKPRSREASAAY